MSDHIRKWFCALVIACMSTSHAAPGDVVAGPHFLGWGPGHLVRPGYLSSVLRTEDGFLVFGGRGTLMKLTLNGQLDGTFGNGGIGRTQPRTTLTAAPNGQLYAAEVQEDVSAGFPGFWLKVARLNEAGEFIHDWGPGNSLVQVRMDAGWPDWEAFRIHADETGVHVFLGVAVEEAEARETKLLYASWNPDGSPRLIDESNVRFIELVLGTDYSQLVPFQVMRDGPGWLVHRQSVGLGADVLAARLTGSGELDPTFGADGVIPAPSGTGRAFGTRLGDALYVLEFRTDETSGEESVWLRRYDRDGQPDTVYGEKRVTGLPESTPDRAVVPLGLFKRGQALDFWVEEQQGESYELSAWPLDLLSGVVTKAERFSRRCATRCTLWGETQVLSVSGDSPAFIHYLNDMPRLVEVPFFEEPDVERPVRVLGDRILWDHAEGFRPARLTLTDLEGTIEPRFGAGRRHRPVNEELPYRTVHAAFLERDGELGLIVHPIIRLCLEIPNHSLPPLPYEYIKAAPAGDFVKESEIDLGERLAAAVGLPRTCSASILFLRNNEDGMDLASEGRIVRVSGQDLEDVAVLQDKGLEVSYLSVLREGETAAVLQMTAAPEAEKGTASFALLDEEYELDPLFNGGEERPLPPLFPGTSCAPQIKSARTDASGKIYLVTYVKCAEFERAYLLRFTVEGNLDADFGDGGMVAVSDGWNLAVTRTELILQSDGKTVVAQSGRQTEESAGQLLVHRYTLSGEPDPVWGNAGVVTVSDASPGRNHELTAMVYRESGNIRLFFKRDEGTSTVELEGDALGPVEEQTFRISAPRSSSSGGVVSLLLLLVFGLAGMRLRGRVH